jgi:hypothetical protein
MKKSLVVLIIILILPVALFSDTWSGGYRIGFQGYVDDNHTSNEYFSSSLLYTPYLTSQGAVEVYGGLSFSNLLFPSPSLYVKSGVSLSHLISQNSPLDKMLIRDSAWWGQIDLGITTSLSSSSPILIEGKIAPFTLFFGDKFISVGSLLLTYNTQSNTVGWGVSLFELTHYLW